MPEYNECIHYGIDPDVVKRFEVRINRLLKDMDKYGLSLFCGSSCSIRANDYDAGGHQLVVGSFSGSNADGGCGASSDHGDGLLRGEA